MLTGNDPPPTTGSIQSFKAEEPQLVKPAQCRQTLISTRNRSRLLPLTFVAWVVPVTNSVETRGSTGGQLVLERSSRLSLDLDPVSDGGLAFVMDNALDDHTFLYVGP